MALTTSVKGIEAFSQPLSTLNSEQQNQFLIGKIAFHGSGVDNRSLEQIGIGPLYNAVNCGECHTHDGRPDPTVSPSSIVRIFNSKSEKGDPLYGKQLQTKALEGTTSEVTNGKLNLGDLDKNSFLFTRTATPVFGMGLIEAIDDNWMYTNADPNDKNKDGISGRIGYVKIDGKSAVAKFGTKSTITSVREQTSLAANEDLGLSEKELGKTSTDALVFYTRALAVPKQRSNTSNDAGKKTFNNLGCSSCHRETAPVGKSDLYTFDKAEIHPFSDFLLHNMGKELADAGDIEGRDADEFRTAPLWGLGLRQTVNGSLFLLHDGRATSIDQAILFHAGEATKAKSDYKNLSQKEKDQLLTYLNSL